MLGGRIGADQPSDPPSPGGGPREAGRLYLGRFRILDGRLFNSNFGYTEIDAVAGYRFNEYVRVGLGLGARYYFDNNKVRSTLSEWAFPIFLNVRGNFIPTRYRDVVPYYSFDIGVTVRDGFMLRPTVGLRVGRERSAWAMWARTSRHTPATT